MPTCIFKMVLFFLIMMAGTAYADEPESTITTLHVDLGTSLNPQGLMLSAGGYRRWSLGEGNPGNLSPYLQSGLALGISPAYGQASVHGEWMPAGFAVMRHQYNLYRFFGANGALLSFQDENARFGKDEVDALEGQEETGFGHRIMFQPTLQAKAGPVIVRNQTDLAYYRFDGKGPFFLEWEYDTLLKDSDTLVANRTQVLYEAWKGRKDALCLLGPYYEMIRASRAELTRRRVGGQLFWVPVDSLWSLDRPRIYSQAGVNLQDRNRKGEAYFTLGIGFDFDL